MKTGPTNPILAGVVDQLKKSKKKSSLLIARKLGTATRRRPEVNLWKIDKYSEEGDFVIVPGKVLADGELTHKITLAAFNYSAKVADKVKGKAKMVGFDELEKAKKIKVIT